MGQPDRVRTTPAPLEVHVGEAERGQTGGGNGGVVLNEWDEDHAKEVFEELKELLEASAVAAKDYARYPLIDLYTNLFKAPVTEPTKPHAPTSINDKYKPYMVKPTVLKFFVDPKFAYQFPLTIGRHLLLVDFEKGSNEWILARKTGEEGAFENPPNEILLDEKYYVKGLVDFYGRGWKNSKYKHAKGKIVYMCEGRTSTSERLKTELYGAAVLLIKEMFGAGGTTEHPLSYVEFKQKGVPEVPKGKSWQNVFAEWIELYNQNLYAQEISGDKHHIDEDYENGIVALKQWAIYFAIATYFKEESAKAITYRDINSIYTTVAEDMERLFKHKIESTDFADNLKKALGIISRHIKGGARNPVVAPLHDSEKKDLKTAVRELGGGLGTFEDAVFDRLEKTLHDLIRYSVDEFFLNYTKLDVSRLQEKIEEKLREYMNSEGELVANDKKMKLEDKDFKELAIKASFFIRTLIEPVYYDMVSLAILTMILRKYINFVANVKKTCEFLLSTPNA